MIYRASGEYRPHYSANGLSLGNDGRSAVLDTSPTLGALDKRENVYAGWMLRIFSDGANFTQERLIESSSISAGAISVKTRTPFEGFLGPDLVYEITPPGFESLMDAITQELLLREAVITRKARSHVVHLQKMRSSAIKVITDILATTNEKDGKRYTVDTPNALRDIYWTIGSGY